jgi:hypothetical protein
MADPDRSVNLKETSGIQFSLSFLIQILGTVILAVWGYSQLDARISQSEHISKTHTYKINSIEANIKESQDKPIPSDHVQNTTLAAHARELLELNNRIHVLEKRLYDHKISPSNY